MYASGQEWSHSDRLLGSDTQSWLSSCPVPAGSYALGMTDRHDSEEGLVGRWSQTERLSKQNRRKHCNNRATSSELIKQQIQNITCVVNKQAFYALPISKLNQNALHFLYHVQCRMSCKCICLTNNLSVEAIVTGVAKHFLEECTQV